MTAAEEAVHGGYEEVDTLTGGYGKGHVSLSWRVHYSLNDVSGIGCIERTEVRVRSFIQMIPVNVERYQKSVLRCNTCGLEFMNHQSVDKWTHSARSSIIPAVS